MKERKLNRLKDYDYSRQGYYFVTICTRNKENWFGEIKNEKMILNEYGEIAKKQWQWLNEKYDYVNLDEFVIMPNHIHGIIIINKSRNDNDSLTTLNDITVGNSRDCSLPGRMKKRRER